MTGPGPGGQPRPFTPSELDGATGVAPEELAGAARVARDLEALAAGTPATASADFTDRVMGAIIVEPAPAPARVAARALRRGALGAFLLSLRDAWRVTTGSRFPVAARAQAFALVLVFAALATGSGMVTVGALGLLDDGRPDGTPSVEPSPELAQPSPDGSPPPSMSPEGSIEPSMSAEPSASVDATASPGETGEPEAPELPDGTGEGGGDDPTPKPTETPDDDDVPGSTETPDDDHTPEPSRTPRPSETPRPSDTPDPSPDDGD